MANYRTDRYDRCLPDDGAPIDNRSTSVIRRRQYQAPQEDYNTTETPIPPRAITIREYEELDRSTEPSQKLRHTYIESQRTTRDRIKKRTAKKSTAFYAAWAAGVVVSGAVIWYSAVSPVIQHWHNGDAPDRHVEMKINGQVCDVVSYLASGKLIVTIIPVDMPQDDKDMIHQIKNYEIKVFAPDGAHIVTVAQQNDEKGHAYLQTYIDEARGPRIVDTGHGQEIEN